MVRKTMAFRVIEGVFVVVHGKANPEDDEWTDYLEYYKQFGRNSLKTLILTEGGGPSTKQRGQMNEALQGSTPIIALCTDSKVVRGIVTAISWFNSNIKAFPREQTQAALAYLSVNDQQAKYILDRIPALENGITAKAG
jgi:hypothetical protein